MLASSFSTRFLLRKNRRSRLPAPLGPLFCRPRHGCAAPGPQRQNPGPPRFQLGFCCAKTGAAGRCPHWGQRARSPIFALLKCGPALAPRPSSFSTRFLLRKNRRSRLPAPPFGFAAQKRARHFAARNHPVRLSASRPWLRHPAPLFCRPRHGSAAPGPQRQNPGACSHSVAFRLRRNRAAGRCPRRGQRARYPIFAPLKCGPAYSRGVCRGTFLCSPAGPTLAPRRLLPFGRISLRETARPVIGPTGADVLACPAFALLKRGPPAKTPALLVFNPVFSAQKPAGASPRFRTAGR